MGWSLSWPVAGARRASRWGMPPLPGAGPPRRRVALIVAFVVSLVVAAVGIASLPGRWKAASAKTTPTPSDQRVVEARVGTVKRVLVLQGVVVRQPDEDVRAPATGTITSISVQPGDEVAAGDTLAVVTLPPPKPVPLPSIPSPSPTPTPTASVTPSPSPSPSPFPTAPPSARAISAPIDGVVKGMNVVLEQEVRTGKLVVVLEPKRFDVIAPVAPPLLFQFFTQPLAITATIAQGPLPFDCVFTSIGDNLEVTGAQTLLTQDADLRCAVPVALNVFPGIRVRLDVTTAQADNAVVLPRRVIQIDGDRGVVWVVEKGHAPAQRTVGLGITDGRNVVITSGLQAGERVLDQSG
jgi:macrolide-specific efflux system membrane fusion protein